MPLFRTNSWPFITRRLVRCLRHTSLGPMATPSMPYGGLRVKLLGMSAYRLVIFLLLLCFSLASHAQVCRLSVAGLNRARKVTGPIHAECTREVVHSAPFGNWGVSSNFGSKHDGHQFDGWCHNQLSCDKDGVCRLDCLDGWYEWNSCTDDSAFAAPNCSLYNSNQCTEQVTTTGVNVHGGKYVDVPVRCPFDSNGDGAVDQGGCKDVKSYASGTNFMSLYELDPVCCDDLVQTVYFPDTVVDLTCDVFGCAPAGSNWVAPSAYDSPNSPVKVQAELATAVAWGEFLDNGGGCSVSASMSNAVNAGSFIGPAVAQHSIVTIFGQMLSPVSLSADLVPLPTSLGSTAIRVTDRDGTRRFAPLFYVSPGQVNFQMPPGTATGQATIEVIGGEVVRSTARVQVESTAPGVFTANASGQGIAAAIAVKVAADGTQTRQLVFQCGQGPASCVANPIDMGSEGDRVILELFGTGIRNHAGISTVGVTVGGENGRVLYAGPQQQYVGLDQVNVEVPADLKGRGHVDVIVSVESKSANTVRVNLL
jgi:uncharacterized protein (TIGR03437 family)